MKKTGHGCLVEYYAATKTGEILSPWTVKKALQTSCSGKQAGHRKTSQVQKGGCHGAGETEEMKRVPPKSP